MTSLTLCLQKAGKLLSAEDKADILRAARGHRSDGLGPVAAGRQALVEQHAKVAELLKAEVARQPGAAKVAPADKTSYSVREDQTETPNFKRWSDNAPVIRAAEAATHDFKTGEPVALQAYHGTAKTFESFGELRGTYTAADGKKQSTYYLTPDAGLAGQYAKDRQRMGSKLADIPDSAPNTMPVYVAMKSPLVVDAKGKNYIDVHDDAIGHAIDKGHDGVIVRNVVDAPNGGAGKPSDVYIAFEPEQIKSATGNNGEYSPKDPRMNYSVSEDQSDTPSFERWSHSAPVIDLAAAKNHVFKNGESVTVQAYHGSDAEFTEFSVQRFKTLPACRFDVVTVEGEGAQARIEWFRAAFDTS